MSTTEMLSQHLFMYFDSISLDEVNRKAALLQRQDNKYLVPANMLINILRDASDAFDVLTISGQRMFAYSTVYYDDSNYQCYLDHHNGKRLRVKVRERLYEQSEVNFLEVKLKSKRKATVKYRMNTQCETKSYLSGEKVNFVNQKYSTQYSRDLDMSFKPSLAMRYYRFTLVSKHSSERVTVDSQLCFIGKSSLTTINDDQLIVEVKSRNGSGVFDKLLRRSAIRSKKKLSKYCLGLCLTDKPGRCNNFLKPMRDLRYITRPNGYESIENALHNFQAGPEVIQYSLEY
jgi:hypothetical protein